MLDLISKCQIIGFKLTDGMPHIIPGGSNISLLELSANFTELITYHNQWFYVNKKDLRLKFLPKANNLNEVFNLIVDPEFNMGINDLGLIYNLSVSNNKLTGLITFTSLNCPFAPAIAYHFRKLSALIGYKTVVLNFTFEPSWSAKLIKPQITSVIMRKGRIELP